MYIQTTLKTSCLLVYFRFLTATVMKFNTETMLSKKTRYPTLSSPEELFATVGGKNGKFNQRMERWLK